MPEPTTKTIAVLDACVLYPPFLRDLLMRLAVVGVYEPRWSAEIHGEWTSNVLTDNPHIIPSQLDRTIRLMNLAVPNSMVSGYERHIPALNLPDINDLHVLATAIEGGAAVIVTFNLKDFRGSVLGVHGIEPLHPDIFSFCTL